MEDRYQKTFQTWNNIASLYQDKFMDLDLYNDTYDLFCESIQKSNPRILEIGCGPGNITKYLLAKRPDFEIEAIDIAPNMIELAKANNPTASFKVMDSREIDTLTPGFDAIVCGFCMPYLSKEDCAKLIKDCSLLLNREGTFYFSTIEGDYDQSGYMKSSNGEHTTYVYFHDESNLVNGLSENNFEVTDLLRKEYLKADDTSETHLIILARKK